MDTFFTPRGCPHIRVSTVASLLARHLICVEHMANCSMQSTWSFDSTVYTFKVTIVYNTPCALHKVAKIELTFLSVSNVQLLIL